LFFALLSSHFDFLYSSSSKDVGELYTPLFAGFVNVDLADGKLSLRSLVSPYINILIKISLSLCFSLPLSLCECFNCCRLIIPLWKALELKEEHASHPGFILNLQSSMMLTCSHLTMEQDCHHRESRSMEHEKCTTEVRGKKSKNLDYGIRMV
jgi:hypothetical protein